MALINCPECQAQVSDQAAACPRCGHPITPPPPTPSAMPAPYSPLVGAGYSQPLRTSGLAIAALVLGLLTGGIGSILALIFGYQARREIDQSNGQVQGRGMATAGIILGWIGIVGAVILTVFVVWALQGGGTGHLGATGGVMEVGSPSVTGDALPPFDTINNDTSLGLAIPEVAGADFAGAPVSITNDGRAKVLIFFAHWCGVCQQEVPLIMDWLPGATLPEGVDLISVSTGVSSARPNYPPSEWFTSEGWTLPLIMDDAASSVGKAFGLTAYPYFVFVNAEGRVALRLTGGLPITTIESIIAELANA